MTTWKEIHERHKRETAKARADYREWEKHAVKRANLVAAASFEPPKGWRRGREMRALTGASVALLRESAKSGTPIVIAGRRLQVERKKVQGWYYRIEEVEES